MAATKGPTFKQQVHEMIDRLPEACTADDIHYRVYLIDKIQRGERALKRGGLAHRDVRKWAAALAGPTIVHD